jgi:hypothetical protein
MCIRDSVTAAQEAAAAQQQGIDAANTIYDQQEGVSEGHILGQLDEQKDLLNPYIEAGQSALQEQQALSGALGPAAQEAAIQGISNSAMFQNALQQGETSILQNAAATGGLRGGNTQAALGQLAPGLLNQAVANQSNQLGQLSGMGYGAAGQAGQGALNAGTNLAGILSDSANAQAALQVQGGNVQGQSALTQYELQRQGLTDLLGLGTKLAGLF